MRSSAASMSLDAMARPAASELGTLGHLGAVAHGGEGRLDRVRGPHMDPALNRAVVDGEQLVEIVGDLGRALGNRGPIQRSHCRAPPTRRRGTR